MTSWCSTNRSSVRIKGSDRPGARSSPARCRRTRAIGRRDSTLVGRQWELAALTGVLDRSIAGSGAVVGLVAPPGVGKSRLVAELAAIAAGRGVSVYSTFCESHATEIPFHAVSRLLRGTFGVDELADEAARAQSRAGLRRGRRGSPSPGRPARHPRPCGAVAGHCAGCPQAPADGSGQRGVAWLARHRPSTSSRTCTGSTRSASRCWPISSRSFRGHRQWC